MAKLTVGIAAHPKRERLVQNLLDGPLWGHPVQVTWDTEDNIWDTHQRAWEAGLEQGGDYLLVLQDDAQLCRNLIPGVEMALPFIPAKSLVSLYFGNARNHPKIARAARQAGENKASWIISTGFWWGVAALLPLTMVEGMLNFCRGRRETYDRRLTIWCEHNQYPVYYPWPSPVDHVDEESLLYPGRRPGRKAFQFAGADYSMLSFDPTGPAVGCGRVPAHLLRGGKGHGP